MTLREVNSMATPAISTSNHVGYPGMDPSFFEPLWYALYTNANHEKRVAQQLGQRSIEHLLPLYDSVRRWKDRRVHLQMPLFPGYVFVRFALRDRLQVLQIPSVAHLVSFSGRPAPLPAEDIQVIQSCLNHGHQVEPHPYLQAGRRARVRSGPLQGLEGIILRRKNRTRFIVSFDLIMRSVAVEIDDIDLVPAC
jgi:transcription antitermination factor NusG